MKDEEEVIKELIPHTESYYDYLKFRSLEPLITYLHSFDQCFCGRKKTYKNLQTGIGVKNSRVVIL
jgi:hypothetical protein